MDRRNFLTKAAACAVSAAIIPSKVRGAQAPSKRINVGFIGTGRQAFAANLPQMLAVSGVQVVTVCDADSWRMAEAQKFVNDFYAARDGKAGYNGCTQTTDFRDVIHNPDIEALMISVPDHWHTTMGAMAAKARKHFALEKPLSLSVQQGRALADVVKATGVTARTDSEFRSVRVQNHAVELIRNGHIGKLQHVAITFPSDPAPVIDSPDMPPPPELNYEIWLGPAPEAPYTEKRVHDRQQTKLRPNWMRLSTYAQGMISNWGAHYFDMVQWANRSEDSGPIEIEGHGEFPNALWDTMINFKVTYRYANGLEMTCEQTPTSTPGITYFGSEAWIKVDKYPGVMTSSTPELVTREPEKGEEDLSKTLWDKNDFIAAIREGRPTMIPIETGHRDISISQIGLIACQVGEKLHWDPAKEMFIGSNRANSMLTAPVPRRQWADV